MNKRILLVDENVALSTVRALREAGYRVVSIAEEQPSASDIQVLGQACELDATIITFDRDYRELIFRRNHPAPRSVLYLRFAPQSPTEITNVVFGLLDPAIAGELDGYLAVWTREGTRKRAFPARA